MNETKPVGARSITASAQSTDASHESGRSRPAADSGLFYARSDSTR